jgi:hypothetical protein
MSIAGHVSQQMLAQFQDVPAALTYLTSDDLMGRVIAEIS